VFERVLIANRGEIARRVQATCRRLGIATVAVCSDADLDAPHVREADEVVRLGPAPATSSYLDLDRVLAAVTESGADAVHPGYGFLSEHAGFAEAVRAAGVTFIGPSAATIRLMGDKGAAKRHLAAAGVPVVPGADTSDLDDAGVLAAAGDVGYPLLVKAVAGGGGKGMRQVDRGEDLAEALAGARREAAAAFGDDRVILERVVRRPRHVEVQVLGDQHGNVVHVLERECSVQRRHQKVVEEAPSPAVDEALRTRMGAAAVAAARSVDYEGAGTVEFLVDGTTLDRDVPDHFFLEMNTRLQVEHPVTELVTGTDLVEHQLRVAAGQPLGFAQDDVRADGHAIEVRLYAEDPVSGLPQTGTLTRFGTRVGPGQRADVGVVTGSEVSRFYDPMLGKLIAHGPDRETAIDRLRELLRHVVAHGVVTNLPLLDAVLADPTHRAGDLTTSFLPDHLGGWRPAAASEQALAVAAAVWVRGSAAATAGPGTGDVFDRLGPLRLAAAGGSPVTLHDGEVVHPRRVRTTRDGVLVTGGEHGDVAVTVVDAELDRHGLDGVVLVDGRPTRVTVTVTADPPQVWVHLDGRTVHLGVETVARRGAPGVLTGETAFTSPMPGALIATPVEVGAHVPAGTTLLVVEAMKMEHPITAPVDGVLTALHVGVGDTVDAGTALLTFAPDTASADTDPGAGTTATELEGAS
jgi:acetyl-CoA/propionyl-CoA carboxylase, biotin carboxylase, biotin carboxyl carrier protein